MKTQIKKSPLFGIKAIGNNLIMCTILFFFCSFQARTAFGQLLTYDNFDGDKYLYYGTKTGILDTIAENPDPNSIYMNKKCAKYIRNSKQKSDNIKMNLYRRLNDLNDYDSYSGVSSVISMKINTNAPVGTPIEIKLGKNGVDDAAAINSVYLGHTSVTNEWHIVKFRFSQLQKGSITSATEIDQINLLFNPNSLTGHTYYFADITGPSLIPEKVELIASPENKEVGVNK